MNHMNKARVFRDLTVVVKNETSYEVQVHRYVHFSLAQNLHFQSRDACKGGSYE